MGSPPSGGRRLQHRLQGAGGTESGPRRARRLWSFSAVELGAGIPEPWLEVPTKSALPVSMPSLKVGQTFLISQGFIGGQEEWGEDRISLEVSAKSSYQPVKVLALVTVGSQGWSGSVNCTRIQISLLCADFTPLRGRCSHKEVHAGGLP